MAKRPKLRPSDDPTSLCCWRYGRALGGLKRECHRRRGHSGRCHDLPFLDHLRVDHGRVAGKIVRDAYQTRGASWGKDAEGNQARKNRQPRWTLAVGHPFYPAHHQEYAVCVEVARELTLQAYDMHGAPACPEEIVAQLARAPAPNTWRCLICCLPMRFDDFALAEESLAAIDTDHINPGLERRHVPGNVAFVHHICNTSKGDRTLEELVNWMKGALTRRGYVLTQP